MSDTQDLIQVITTQERHPKTLKLETIVSHGVHLATGKTVIMPCERIEDIGAQWHPDFGWVIPVPQSHKAG